MADYASCRTTMVDTQVRPSDVTKFPIIDAMLRVQRELYVPDGQRAVAYSEGDIELGEGRVVLAPRTFAKMLEASGIGAQDVVLDLGCGLGYSTAVLARMARAVVAVEPNEAWAEEAQRCLSEQGADDAAVLAKPLADGAPQTDPYDAIIVQGGIQQWPDALTAQLREGGHVVAIWCEGRLGTARLGRKLDGAIIWRDVFNVWAPVLPGFEKQTEFAL